jgi:hypothetical protein
VVAWATYTLFAEGVALSSEAQQSADVPGLRRGWLLGWQMDLSDTQWRDFRGSLHILAAAMKGFVLLSLLVGVRALPRRACAGSCCRFAAAAARRQCRGLLPLSCMAAERSCTLGPCRCASSCPLSRCHST